MESVNRLVSGLSPAWIVAGALLVVGVIGVGDHLAGVDFPLSVFYLGPVALATWYGGRRAGFITAVISSVSSLSADLSAGHLLSRPTIIIWKWLVQLAFLLVTRSLLHALRAHLEFEQQQARTDSVTGILNNRAFAEHLQYSLDLTVRQAQPLTLAYIDLDDFKSVNDRFGHDEGDRVLRLVARTLTEAIRRTDVVARLSGDEFILLLPSTDRAGAESVIAKARESLQAAFRSERSAVTCSIGAVTFQGPALGAAQAIKTADSLMYEAKRHGKNTVAYGVVGPLTTHGTPPGVAGDAPRTAGP